VFWRLWLFNADVSVLWPEKIPRAAHNMYRLARFLLILPNWKMCIYGVTDLTALTISMSSNSLASIYENKLQTGHHPIRALWAQAQYQVLIYCNCVASNRHLTKPTVRKKAARPNQRKEIKEKETQCGQPESYWNPGRQRKKDSSTYRNWLPKNIVHLEHLFGHYGDVIFNFQELIA